MTHSEALVKASFNKQVFNKRGSLYIEASMLMPLACFIMIALMGIIMTFYGHLVKQTENHKEEVCKWECTKEIELIRNYERFIDWI